MKFTVLTLMAFVLGMACAVPGAKAEDAKSCSLLIAARLPISFLPNGWPTVPIRIAGKTYPMLLGLSEPRTVISANAVEGKDVAPQSLADGTSMFVMGHEVVARGTLTSIMLGDSKGTNVPAFFVDKPFAPGTGGVLGLDVLSIFDLELNLAGKELVLFRHEHCPGEVVYWGRPHTVVPFRYSKTGNMVVPLVLDGKPVDTNFNVMNWQSVMSIANSDVMDLIGGSSGAKEFRYPFKALTLHDLVVKNPDIVIYRQKRRELCHGMSKAYFGICEGGANLMLGRHVMRQLRLYFAFKEEKLYATVADPAPDTPAK